MKLDSKSIIYNSLERFFAVFVFFAISAFFDGTGFWTSVIFTLLPLAVFFGFISVYQYFYWRNFEYYFDEDVLKIESGVIATRVREVPIKRVQNVDVRENVLQRALGLAEIRFETAGGGSTEGVLKCVSREEKQSLKNRVNQANDLEELEASEGEKIYDISNKELALVSLTSFSIASAFGIFATLAVGSTGLITQYGLQSEIETSWVILAIPLLFLGSIIGSWLVNGFKNFVKYYDFELYLRKDNLEYKTGLLRRYSGKIPTNKLQSAVISENVVQRRLGYAGLSMETAGYSVSQKQDNGSEMTIPMAKRHQIVSNLKNIEGIEADNLAGIPKRARTRFAIRYNLFYIIPLLIIAIAAGVQPVYGAIASLPLIFLSILGSWKKHENIGYLDIAEESYFVVRNGYWNRRTKYVPYYRIQNIIRTQTILQRRWGLSSLIIDTAGSFTGLSAFVVAKDLDEKQSEELSIELFEGLQNELKSKRDQ